MDLYVLSPAFGLASIDADCLAAIALLKKHCRSTERSWRLIACHEDDELLPILKTEDRSYQGYVAIAKYLSSDDELSAQQKADTAALGAFIQTNGQPLLDVSYYVSFENFRSRTRAAFTRTLPWYANYIIPPRRRVAARKRTEHLGVSSLDMDDAHESVLDDSQSKPKFEHATEKRARTLLGGKQTIGSMLQKPEHAGAFRLKALADAFYEPLADFLEDKDFLLDNAAPSSVDCLAYGYLALMRFPQLLQNWLSEIMLKKYPKLVKYVERLAAHFDMDVSENTLVALIDKPTTSEKVLAQSNLPWSPAQPQTTTKTLSFIGKDLWSRLLLTSEADSALSNQLPFWQRHLTGLLALSSASSFLIAYWLRREGLWPHGDSIQIFGRKRLADYGAAGAALAALGGQVQNESIYQQQRHHEAPVEVDVVVQDDLTPRDRIVGA